MELKNPYPTNIEDIYKFKPVKATGPKATFRILMGQIRNYLEPKSVLLERLNNNINRLSELSDTIKNNVAINYLCQDILADDYDPRYDETFKFILKSLLQIGVDPNIFLHPDYSVSQCYKLDNSMEDNANNQDFLNRELIAYKKNYLPLAKKVIDEWYDLNGLNQKMPDFLVDYTKTFLTDNGMPRTTYKPPGSPKSPRRNTALPLPRMGFNRAGSPRSKKGSKSPRRAKKKSK